LLRVAAYQPACGDCIGAWDRAAHFVPGQRARAGTQPAGGLRAHNRPHAIKAHYRNASICGNYRVVFNISGNKYRLVVEIGSDGKEATGHRLAMSAYGHNQAFGRR